MKWEGDRSQTYGKEAHSRQGEEKVQKKTKGSGSSV